MNEHEKNQSLLADLHALARIEPDAETSQRAIKRAREQLIRAARQPELSVGRKRWLRTVGMAAAALVAMTLLAHWMSLPSATDGLAFAQVQGQVARVKTVQYVQTRKVHLKGQQLEPIEVRKVMILGSHQIREELRRVKGDPLPEGATWAKGDPEDVMIRNMKTGRWLDLEPGPKLFSVPQAVFGIDQNGQAHEQKIEPVPDVDFYNEIRTFPADKAKTLPNRVIDGRAATGFQIVETATHPGGDDTLTRTYWIDRQTRLPVRIEASRRSTNPRTADTDSVRRDFVFDAPLDPALFSTDPPAGYTDRDQIPQPGEKAGGKTE